MTRNHGHVTEIVGRLIAGLHLELRKYHDMATRETRSIYESP